MDSLLTCHKDCVMLRIGVLGAGHLGKIHIKLLSEMPEWDLVGIYDPDEDKAEEACGLYNVNSFRSIEAMLNEVDAIDIVTPTLSHFECAEQALRASKHIFIEKPITNTLEEAKKLLELEKEANVKAQVGHVERFNPAFTAASPMITNPMFIETHRLAQFNPRGTDVSVVLDLMIHDIDIILSMVDSNIKQISASGVAVVSETPDIANARIEFDTGCVANLTASRISLKNMRKTRLFQKDAYVTIDFLEKETQIVEMEEVTGEPDPLAIIMDLDDNRKKEIRFLKPEVKPNNAIQDELRAFHTSITEDTKPIVTLDDGYKALRVAYEIVEKLKMASIHEEA